MKKYFGLLVGGLALILFSSTASATTTALIECGTGATSTSGTGNPTLVPTVLTCLPAAFTLPTNITITALSFEIVDDAQGPATVGSQINWTWTEGGADTTGLGLSTVANETSTTGTTFNACTNAPGPLVCDQDVNVAYSGTVAPTISFTVSATAVNGGISINGGDSAELYADITYSVNSGVPEPATLSMVGAALLGLGMIARKRRNA
jgi:hypothetical protein